MTRQMIQWFRFYQKNFLFSFLSATMMNLQTMHKSSSSFSRWAAYDWNRQFTHLWPEWVKNVFQFIREIYCIPSLTMSTAFSISIVVADNVNLQLSFGCLAHQIGFVTHHFVSSQNVIEREVMHGKRICSTSASLPRILNGNKKSIKLCDDPQKSIFFIRVSTSFSFPFSINAIHLLFINVRVPFIHSHSRRIVHWKIVRLGGWCEVRSLHAICCGRFFFSSQ